MHADPSAWFLPVLFRSHSAEFAHISDQCLQGNSQIFKADRRSTLATIAQVELDGNLTISQSRY